MKILVCIAQVPDTGSRLHFNASFSGLDKDKMSFVVSPYDDYALGRAVELRGDGVEVSVLHVGGEEGDTSLRKALAIGADRAYRVNRLATSGRVVADEVSHFLDVYGSFDLLMFGRETSDFHEGMVGAMVSELSGIEMVSNVMSLDVEGDLLRMRREGEDGIERIEASFPLIVTCQEPIADWKIPNMRGIMLARSKPLEVVSSVSEQVIVNETVAYHPVPPRGAVKMLDNMDELVSLLQQKDRVL